MLSFAAFLFETQLAPFTQAAQRIIKNPRPEALKNLAMEIYPRAKGTSHENGGVADCLRLLVSDEGTLYAANSLSFIHRDIRNAYPFEGWSAIGYIGYDGHTFYYWLEGVDDEDAEPGARPAMLGLFTRGTHQASSLPVSNDAKLAELRLRQAGFQRKFMND